MGIKDKFLINRNSLTFKINLYVQVVVEEFFG